ncbi:MAG: isoprenylcysteine carboxylmethyltransferase family protein [Planctomycetia bacterium]|nr:isoprenylcysteine carboxylmethyltransferase family protein [Planctomycetia bacterium]
MARELREKLRTRMTWMFGFGLACVIFLSRSAWEDHPLVEESLFLTACLLIGLGSLGRAWCAVFISGRKDHVLVQKGPYAMSRNPLYFFSFLAATGIGFGTETIAIPLFIILSFAIYYPYIIRAEERRLEDLFGDDFRQYKSRVPCFFPRWSLLNGNEPESYEVNTKVLRRALFDLLWFFWIVGLFELIEALHAMKIIPVLFQLY